MSELPKSSSSRRVVIVDDSRVERELLALEFPRLEIVGFPSLHEAYAAISDDDVVILDWLGIATPTEIRRFCASRSAANTCIHTSHNGIGCTVEGIQVLAKDSMDLENWLRRATGTPLGDSEQAGGA